MLLEAALNGPRTKGEHSTVPVTSAELAADAIACVAEGAGAIHLHPRGPDGGETLDAAVVNAVVARVRAASGVPVGVSTGAWIEPDAERRIALLEAWTEPDFASVNVSEPGAGAVVRVLRDRGIGVEAGVWTVEDVDRLRRACDAGAVLRVLVEPVAVDVRAALATVAAIHAALDAAGISAQRLQHGDGEATWVLIEDAVARGIATRVGLEDTLYERDGSWTEGNAALVRCARRLGAGAGEVPRARRADPGG